MAEAEAEEDFPVVEADQEEPEPGSRVEFDAGPAEEYGAEAEGVGGRIGAPMRRSPLRKSRDGQAHRPPMWSVEKYGSAHGNWDLVAAKPNEALRQVDALETMIKAAVLSVKNRFDVAPSYLTSLLALGDHGNATRPRKLTGRISVEKFQYLLRTKLRSEVKAKMKEAYRNGDGLGEKDPLCAVGGVEPGVKRQPKYFLVLTEDEVRSLFRKYGHDSNERMPYEVFAQRLFAGASHKKAMEGRRDRPFLADKPAEWPHVGNGMIQYRLCRRGVFAPSNWPDVHKQVCSRSAEKPEAYLKLEHVFGYSGMSNTAPNLFYNAEGDVVYYTAGVGIVYNDETNKQKFFLRHDDDISSLALHPDRDTVATGQVASIGPDGIAAPPIVWIWSSSAVMNKENEHGRAQGPKWMEENKQLAAREKNDPIKIELPRGQRGVQALAFSRCGEQDLLLTVSTDNEHTVNVWEWRRREEDRVIGGKVLKGNVVHLASKSSCAGVPPQVFCCAWQPEPGFFSEAARERGRRERGHEEGREGHFADFITAGVNHIKFWRLDRKAKKKEDRLKDDEQHVGNFSTRIEVPSANGPRQSRELKVTQQDVLHFAYLPNGFVAAGGPNGSITLYNGYQAVKEIGGGHWLPNGEYKPRNGKLLHRIDDPDSEDHGKIDVDWGQIQAHMQPRCNSEDERTRRDLRTFCMCVRTRKDGSNVLLSGAGDGRVLEWEILEPQYDIDKLGNVIPADDQTPPQDYDAEGEEGAGGGGGGGGGARSPRADWEAVWVKEHGEKYAMLQQRDPVAWQDLLEEEWSIHFKEESAGGLQQNVDATHKPKREDDVPAYTAIDTDPDPDSQHPDKFIAGSKQNDVWEIDADPRVLVEGQSADVYGLAPHPTMDDIYASGCEDGSVYLWDAAQKTSIKAFQVRRQSAQRPEGCEAGELLKVKAVAFSSANDERGGLFALSTAGVISERPPVVIDGVEQEEPDHPDQGGGLQVFTCGATANDPFFVTESDGEMTKEDCAKFYDDHCIWEKKDSNEVIDDIKFSPSVEFLAAASHDNYIYVYRIDWEGDGPTIKLHTKCKGHSSYVTHLDWSADSSVLLSNSGDYELLYWALNKQRTTFELYSHSSTRNANLRDVEWASWTGVLGFEAMGIWQEGMDGTDYNALHRSEDHGGKRFCVGSTDDGLVRLFNHPVVIDKAPHHRFRGHSSHVQNVRFLTGDKRVVSAGGRDGSMMQWVTRGVTKPVKTAGGELKKLVKDSRAKPAPTRAMGRPGARARAATPEEPQPPTLEELQQQEALNREMLKEKEKEIRRLKSKLTKAQKSSARRKKR